MFICAASFFLGACTAEKGITVHDAWMLPTAQGENGAVYFVLQNDSTEHDELIEVSSDLADSVEMHESSMMAGTDVMQMNQVPSVALDANSKVTFAPGGLHVMLVGVKNELKTGDVVEITLHFRNHADIPVSVSVAEFAPDEHSH
jgi:copper(I)-binding protein